MKNEELKVESLSKQLPQVPDDLIIDLAQQCNTEDWGGNMDIDEHGNDCFECDLTFVQFVDNYRVQRLIGCGVSYDFQWLHNQIWYHGYSDAYQIASDRNMVEDTNIDTMLDWHVEFGQIWHNVVNGKTFYMTRTNEQYNLDEHIELHISDGMFYGHNGLGVRTMMRISYCDSINAYQEITMLPFVEKSGFGAISPFNDKYYSSDLQELLKKQNDIISAYLIAKRHGYKHADTDMWAEYVGLLQEFNKDLHNPFYICPNDLQSAHNKLIAKKQRLLEQKEREERLRQAQLVRLEMEQYKDMLQSNSKANKAYLSNMGKYLNITISGGDYIIEPLKNVKEFYEEGTAMHHCVFNMGYYKKFTSLIMSVRDNAGNRVATVEYDLRNNTILQCYAAYDKIPVDNDNIRQLILSHAQEIRRIYNKAI